MFPALLAVNIACDLPSNLNYEITSRRIQRWSHSFGLFNYHSCLWLLE